MLRRLHARNTAIGVATTVAVAVMLAVVPASVVSAGAFVTTCQVTNVTAATPAVASLQAAVSAAGSGDTLHVVGTCVGPTTIDLNLYIRGIWTASSGKPTLDGANVSRVLTIAPGTTVKIKDLVIRRGSTTASITKQGAGILASGRLNLVNVKMRNNVSEGSGGAISIVSDTSTVTLYGRTSIDHNSGYGCAGVDVHSGTLRMKGSSSIAHNTATTGDGGGVCLGGQGLSMEGSSSIHDNSAGGTGGGIRRTCGTLTGVVDGGNVYGNDPNNIVSDVPGCI